MVDDLNPPVVFERDTNNFQIKVEGPGNTENAYLNIMIFPGNNF
jgi:hypothetical protein